MDYRKVAIEDLRGYTDKKQSLCIMRERIVALQDSTRYLHGAALNDVPARGGGTAIEDQYNNDIVELDKLKRNYSIVAREVKRIHKAYHALRDNERRVLELFYINKVKDCVELLCEELGYERSNIYNIKDAALKRFTVLMYGVIDL